MHVLTLDGECPGISTEIQGFFCQPVQGSDLSRLASMIYIRIFVNMHAIADTCFNFGGGGGGVSRDFD